MKKRFSRTNEANTHPYKHKWHSRLMNRTAILLLLMAVTMWQCDKDDYEEVPGICPEVTSTNPANQALGVPLSQVVSATFNEKINPVTLTEESFILQKGGILVPGTVSYTNMVASFRPATALLPNTIYTGTVKTTVKDEMGNVLQTDYVWTFTTNMSPGVILTDPLNNATDVDLAQIIAATFSVPMDPASLTMSTFNLKNGSTPIAGTITYSDETAFFTPTQALVPATIYTATITTGAKTATGTAFESDYVWSFNTGGIPAITFTDPANLEEEVALDKTITATFSEEMDPTTLTSTTFTLKQGAVKINGVVSTNGTVVSFNPNNSLLYGTTYTATITKDAKNSKGKTLVTDYVWTFTTNNLAPPTIISTIPTNNAGNIDLNTNISATFAKPMDATTFSTSTFTVKQGTTAIPGVVSFNGSTATFNPDNNLSYGTSYTVTISSGVKSQDGIAMVSDYVWTFSTKNATAPTVVSTDPADNAINVELNKNISATFSVPMNETTLNASSFTVKLGANIVPGTITYNGNTATFNPTNDLSYGATYIVTITTGAKNTEGTPLVSNYVWTFTTKYAPAPTVLITDPANNTNGVVLGKVITATFNEAIDPATLNNTTFTLKRGNVSVSGSVTTNGAIATFTPTTNLVSGVNYTATLTTGVKNTHGTNLANTYTWSFNTVAPLGPTAVDLKTAARFGILAGEQIVNNTGATEVRNMDIGVTPGLHADITGFPPGTVLGGSIFASDDGATTAAMLVQAQIDLVNAYEYAEGLIAPTPTILGFDIGGQTLEPGLYKSQSTMLIQNGNVILDAKGDANAVWIFQIASGLNTIGGYGGNVILTNGAQAKNIFWQVGNSAVLGEGTTFHGTILALNTITMNIGSTITGRLLARHNSVYINTVIINKP